MINRINKSIRDNKNIINVEWRIEYCDKTKRNRGNNKVNS